MLEVKKRSAPPRLDIHGAFVRRLDLSGTSLRGANMSGADATNANFAGADFFQARLSGAILRGANLSNAVNLTVEQLSEAVLDESTILPAYIDRQVLEKAAKSSQL